MESRVLIAIVLAGNDENRHILGGIGQPAKFFMPFGDERVGDRMLRAIATFLRVVGFRGALPLARITAGLRGRASGLKGVRALTWMSLRGRLRTCSRSVLAPESRW